MIAEVEDKRVLVIADEAEGSLEIQAALWDAGFDVIAPVLTFEDGMNAVKQGGFQAVVVDANLNGRNAGGIASLLTDRRFFLLW